MNENQLKLAIGGLLHDTGKILFRGNDQRNHSTSGYEFLKDEVKLPDEEILEQVLYHHSDMIRNAKIKESSLAYITYVADNIAAGIDRREGEENLSGFDKSIPLQSVFNILNGNQQKFSYQPSVLNQSSEINYPSGENITFDEFFYARIKDNIKHSLMSIEITEEYINSLLELLEANLTFIPSSTYKKELADISLYDHVKLTAAIGNCIFDYLSEKEITNYREALYINSKNFYDEKAFLIYSLDISGIQDFIYTITSKGALKALRSRSFYLEIILEHMIDEILLKLNLSRANLIYSGGGHAYLILANTNFAEETIKQFEVSMNKWFIKTFKTSLFVAGGYNSCSANQLKNEPKGEYKKIFKEVSKKLSSKKLHRYNFDDIKYLNTDNIPNGERECIVCKRTDFLTEGDKCEICENLEKMSTAIFNNNFFTVLRDKPEELYLPLPGDKYLVADNLESLKTKMKSNDSYIRSYGKNEMYTGYHVATKLWVGDYKSSNTFEDLAKSSTGLERIAVLRADVDNLGQAFVSGFENKNFADKYVTLSRTATFSRKLSVFFKLHINNILENGQYYLTKNPKSSKRNAAVVYSGGDDLFVVGSWDDIIGFSIDLHNSLKTFTQNTLTISAGIGIYNSKYPISAMAKQTGALEEISKKKPGKNSITLFDEENSFSWDRLTDKVLNEKLALISNFFDNSNERGKSYLYNLLELIRNKDEKISLARYAYLLARLEPDEKADETQKELYNHFSKQMYNWMQSKEDCKDLTTAIYIYAYLNREKGEENNG